MRCLVGPLLPVLLLVAGCATPQGSVVLLPERDGKDSALVVSQGTQQLVLSQPYAGAGLSSRGPEARQWDPQAVRTQFGAALAAQPQAPTRFTLYFVEGKDEFTEESKRVIDGIFAEIAKRAVPDVVVIGHTDRLGTDAYNDALSRQRAEVVRSALLTRGIAVDKVVAIGRGKREPVVPTADGVAEPRNRRVESQVR
jgi:OOP family OmpA-OmpF porin